MNGEYETPAEALYAVWARLCADSSVRLVSPRGQPTREMPRQVTLVIDDPLAQPIAVPGRRFRHAITGAEGLSLVGQTSLPEVVVDRVGAFRKFLRHSVFWGAYGPRVAGDVGNAVELLRRDPDSRQAVLTIFDADRDLGRDDQLDLPCTVSVQFLWRERLEMRVGMRSNDAWLGLPYDLGQFAMLQAAVAQALGAVPGPYTHTAQSMHLYERDLEKARAAVAAGPPGEPAVFAGAWWGASEIGAISGRARRMLIGEPSADMTPFESWLYAQLWETFP